MTVEELAKYILESKAYGGGKIRSISCEAGKIGGYAAQKLANILCVEVKAPSELVKIYRNGDYKIESESGEKGEWKRFTPQK